MFLVVAGIMRVYYRKMGILSSLHVSYAEYALQCDLNIKEAGGIVVYLIINVYFLTINM